jgi:transcriptional regulator with XRE-family HTH domain
MSQLKKEKYMQVFVQRLIGGRNRKGLTQTELAKELGVHLRSIQNWEGGLTEPRGKDLRKLSTVLDLSIPFLLGMEDDGVLRVQTASSHRTVKFAELRQRVHEYLDKVLDECRGDEHRISWTFVELRKKFPVTNSGVDAVAADILSGEEASGSHRGQASSRSRGAGAPSARISGPGRGAGKPTSKKLSTPK